MAMLEEFYGLDLAERLLPTTGCTLAVDSDSAGNPRYLCLMSQATSNASIRHASSLAASQVGAYLLPPRPLAHVLQCVARNAS